MSFSSITKRQITQTLTILLHRKRGVLGLMVGLVVLAGIAGGIYGASSGSAKINHSSALTTVGSPTGVTPSATPTETPVPTAVPTTRAVSKAVTTAAVLGTTAQLQPSPVPGQSVLPLVFSQSSLMIAAGGYVNPIYAHLTNYINADGTFSDDEIICSLSGQILNGYISVGLSNPDNCSNQLSFAVFVRPEVPNGVYNLKVSGVTKQGLECAGVIQVTVPPPVTPTPTPMP